MKIFRKLYGLLICFISYLQSPFLLIIRLYWGWQFFLTGKGKLSHLDKTAAYFNDLHIPMAKFNAVMAGCTECFGGLLLLIGLASRLASIPLAVTMMVAYLTAEREAVAMIFSDPDKFLSAAPFLFLYTVLIILIFGPGAFSLDRLIAKIAGKGK